MFLARCSTFNWVQYWHSIYILFPSHFTPQSRAKVHCSFFHNSLQTFNLQVTFFFGDSEQQNVNRPCDEGSGHTHSAGGSHGHVVHLLGEGSHHVSGLHGDGVVHGWRYHSTLHTRINTNTHRYRSNRMKDGRGNELSFNNASGRLH